jgi:hypothetical protein
VLDRDERVRLRELEERVSRLEAQLSALGEAPIIRAEQVPLAHAPVFAGKPATEDELEFEIGQNWFALAGIFVLTAGVAFMLSLRYAQLPAALPGSVGYLLALGLLAIAHVGARALSLLASYLRAAALTLLGFAALRLFFFGATPAVELAGVTGRGVLAVTIALAIGVGLSRGPWLTGWGLVIAGVLAIAAGSAWFALIVSAGVAAVAIAAGRRPGWSGLWLAGMAVSYLTYLGAALGASFGAGRLHFTSEPPAAPFLLYALIVAYGLAPFAGLRKPQGEDAVMNVNALLNCILGFGVFLLHTAASFPAAFPLAQLGATLGFLALAVVFFIREHSRIATFFYAMTGYAALSLAIVNLWRGPPVFVWLSVQSVIVVTTAIWFRSRFIVVANFFIFVGIALAYLFVTGAETGISVGFGIVALLSARILNWQRDRLELKTGLMRNAYLVSGFLVFPYALYHLVPPKFVAVAWVALAGAYYLLNVLVKNQKYRWMGHATLGLATLYVASVGVSRFEPVYRVLSFLVLGTVLLLVSLSFTRARRRGLTRDAGQK